MPACGSTALRSSAPPPPNRSRPRQDCPATLRCGCEDCRALARFLADPSAQVARFPLNEQRRRHLHGQIEVRQCDCTHDTERKGRPFTLVCKKTTASYQRRKTQYRLDSKLLG